MKNSKISSFILSTAILSLSMSLTSGVYAESSGGVPRKNIAKFLKSSAKRVPGRFRVHQRSSNGDPRIGVIVNSFNYSRNIALNSFATIFGSGLKGILSRPERCERPNNFSAPTILCGTRVLINQVSMPLLYVSDYQINFRIDPVGLAGGFTFGGASFQVIRDEDPSNVVVQSILTFAPYAIPQHDNHLIGLTLHSGGSFPVGNDAAAARPGAPLQIFATGITGGASSPTGPGPGGVSPTFFRVSIGGFIVTPTIVQQTKDAPAIGYLEIEVPFQLENGSYPVQICPVAGGLSLPCSNIVKLKVHQ